MAQNRPKIGVSVQNKQCQNTAERKLRLNTPQGRSGCITFCGLWAAWYQLWPQRGLQAPFEARFGMDFLTFTLPSLWFEYVRLFLGFAITLRVGLVWTGKQHFVPSTL